MALRAGYALDSKLYTGTAHVIEHSRFRAQERPGGTCPLVDFLSEHNGEESAEVDAGHSLYGFEVEAAAFEGALALFAEIFLPQKLSEASVLGAIPAVVSEFKDTLKEENPRAGALIAFLANPRSDRVKLGDGTPQSLREPGFIAAARQAFHQHYHTNNYVLVVHCSDAKRAAKAVEAAFASLGPAPFPPSSPSAEPFFRPQDLGILVHERSFYAGVSLTLHLPFEEDLRKAPLRPLNLLTAIINNTGPGSFFDEVRRRGLATDLILHQRFMPNRYSQFTIRIILSTEGTREYVKVVQLFFGYISFVRENFQRYIYDDLRDYCAHEFDLNSQLAPADCTELIAKNALVFPPAEVLSALFSMADYSAEDVKLFLARIKPENAIAVLSSSAFTNLARVEPVFGTQHSVTPLKLPTQAVSANFALPAPALVTLSPLNRLEAPKVQAAAPTEVTPAWYRHCARLFSHQDWQFLVPVFECSLDYTLSATMADSAEQIVAKEVMLEAFKSRTEHLQYQLSRLHIKYSSECTHTGFKLSVRGPTAALQTALKELFAALKDFLATPAASEFETQRGVMCNNYANLAHLPFGLYVDYAWKWLAAKDIATPAAKARAGERLSFERFSAFCKTCLAQYWLEGLISGGVTAPAAASAFSAALDALPVASMGEFRPREVRLVRREGASALLLPVVQKNSPSGLLSLQYYIGEAPSDHAFAAVVEAMVAGEFFAVLREQQETGYNIGASRENFRGHALLRMVVQSPDVSTAESMRRVEQFLRDKKTFFDAMSAKDFEAQKQKILSAMPAGSPSIREQHNAWCSVLVTHAKGFDRQAALHQAVRALTFAEFARKQRALGGQRLQIQFESAQAFSATRAELEAQLARGAIAGLYLTVEEYQDTGLTYEDRHSAKAILPQ